MLIVAQIWFARFSYVPPEFLRSLFSIARAVRYFFIFYFEPALKIAIVKVYGLLHALSCQIS